MADDHYVRYRPVAQSGQHLRQLGLRVVRELVRADHEVEKEARRPWRKRLQRAGELLAHFVARKLAYLRLAATDAGVGAIEDAAIAAALHDYAADVTVRSRQHDHHFIGRCGGERREDDERGDREHRPHLFFRLVDLD